MPTHHPYWILAPLVAIFGVAILGRWRPRRRAPSKPRPPRQTRRPVEPLRPGEVYDTAVKLAAVPNAPLADLWCQRLRAEGIEAFYKSGISAPAFAGGWGGAAANPGVMTEIWVGEHDLARARELFPELA